MNKKYFLFLSIGTLIVGGLILMSAKSAIHEIKALLAISRVNLNSTFTLELSHHKGKKNFRKTKNTAY